MENGKFFHIGIGCLRSVVITLVMFFIVAVVMLFTEIKPSALNAIAVVGAMLSIVYGAIYSAKKIGSRGWLIGMLVAFMYMLFIYLIAIATGSTSSFSTYRLYILLISLGVGAFSGMLGINL